MKPEITVAAMLLFAALAESQAATTAYINPAGAYAPFASPYGLVPLGLDFDVQQGIFITSLGAYDFGQDGVFLHDVQVGIFNRDTGFLVDSAALFGTSSPGTLELGSRFKTLLSPIVLPAGFHGSVVAYGYSSTGFGGGELFLEEFYNHPPPQSTDTGGGLISFVASRFGGVPGFAFPTSVDTFVSQPAWTVNQYAAGTFQFVAAPEASTNLAGALIAGLAVWGWRRRQALVPG